MKPLLALALLLFAAGSVSAETIVPGNASLFSDHSALVVGDALTILIVESTQASKSTLTRTHTGTSNNLGSSGRLDIFGEWGLSADNKSIGEGSTARRGDFKARITAKITDIDDNGLLIVEGRRSVIVNGEDEIIILRGSVRPQDVRQDNTVFSTYLADASIEYTGKGVLASAERPGIITRVFNWIF